jgi:hypothetical protein
VLIFDAERPAYPRADLDPSQTYISDRLRKSPAFAGLFAVTVSFNDDKVQGISRFDHVLKKLRRNKCNRLRTSETMFSHTGWRRPVALKNN